MNEPAKPDVAQAARRIAELEAELAALRRTVGAAIPLMQLISSGSRADLVERVVGNVPAGMALIDIDHVFRWVNPQYARVWGRDSEDFVGRTIYEIFPEMERPSPRLEAVAASGEVVHARGLRFVGRAGERFVDNTYVPLFGADGALEAVLVMVLDVTHRERIERMQLEQIEALQRADALKDQFLGVVSHELRTPIHILSTVLRVVRKGLAGPVSPQQGAYLDRAMLVMQRLRRLVEDILDMTMLQAGTFRLLKERVDVRDLLARVLEDLASLAADKDTPIALEVVVDPPLIPADPERLMQVFLNVVGNAVKFSPAGSPIRVQVSMADGRLRCEVTDRGPGISPEAQEAIFRPFTQLDMSLTREVGGVGLGLSISKALVEAHGGAIGVESVPGRGSTFWVELPVDG